MSGCSSRRASDDSRVRQVGSITLVILIQLVHHQATRLLLLRPVCNSDRRIGLTVNVLFAYVDSGLRVVRRVPGNGRGLDVHDATGILVGIVVRA